MSASRHARGYGSRWVKLRRQALLRDDFLCQHCLLIGNHTAATDVDHIIPKADGGADSMTNLQSLCRSCHSEKTRLENSHRKGNKRVIGIDGWPVDPEDASA